MATITPFPPLCVFLGGLSWRSSENSFLLYLHLLSPFFSFSFFNRRLIISIKESLKKLHPEKQIATYGDITRALLGPGAGQLVDYILVSMQLGICTVYFRFIPTNLHATFTSVYGRLSTFSGAIFCLSWIAIAIAIAMHPHVVDRTRRSVSVRVGAKPCL